MVFQITRFEAFGKFHVVLMRNFDEKSG